MNIKILHLLTGAKEATGLTVIIDVFRAFSLEAYLFSQGAEVIYPIGSIAKALELKKEHPEYISFGEREGAKVKGFDYGNSPSSVLGQDLTGKRIIHTTSAGTQGITNAAHADEIITGSLVNAKAIATYIKQKNPKEVSLVCMGWQCERDTAEDVLCAEYIKSLLEDKPFENIEERALQLKELEGKKFFNPELQDKFPEQDFWMCTKTNIFDFVIQSKFEDNMLVNRRFDIKKDWQ